MDGEWRSIRQTIGLTDHAIDTLTMERIYQEHVKTKPLKPRPYGDEDLARYFVNRHLLEAVTKKLKLTRVEKGLVKTVIGQIHQEPPLRIHDQMIEAASKLHKKGNRGNRIFRALLEEQEKLSTEHQRTFTDTSIDSDDVSGIALFANPITDSFALDWRGKNNFKELAEHLKEAKGERISEGRVTSKFK